MLGISNIDSEEEMVLKNQTLPWIEKYRPKSLDEILSHEEIIGTLKIFLENKCLPHLLFYGPSGCGKCLAGNTKIIMADGQIKLARDILIGDKLLGDNNRPRTVLGTCSGFDILYKIIQENSEEYIINSAHIISLKLTHNFYIRYSPANIYYLYWFENHELKIHAENNYENIINKKNNIIKNNNHNKIGDILDINILKYLEKPDIWKKSYSGYKIGRVTCWPKNPVNMDPYNFGKLLLLNKNIKKIPHEYIYNNLETRAKLLSGYLNIGYNILDNKTNFQIIYNLENLNKYIIPDIIFIARSLGYQVKNNNIYISNYNINNTINRIQVQKLDYGQYFGFELDGNGRFILGDFTVTHNTSCIMACAKELYGSSFPLMVMELNASDDRGIEVVRTKIKQFVTAKNFAVNQNTENLFKLVILDETDAMTADAQAILRKIVEKYTYNTRFCLICNYIQNINIALQSRCTRFRFSLIAPDKIKQKILSVCQAENIKITADGLTTIIKRSGLDMRRAINLLQSTSMAYNIINDKTVNTCLGYPVNNLILKILEFLIKSPFKIAYSEINKIIHNQGIYLNDIITEIHNIFVDQIINNKKIKITENLNLKTLQNILDKLRVIEFNQSMGASQDIQLAGLVSIFKINL